MKKIYSLLMLLIAGLCTQAFADKGTLVLSTPNTHQVLSFSPNGKWACGIDASSGSNRAFSWNLETGEITYYGKSGGSSSGEAISDNGIVCGTDVTNEVNENGAPMESGGYWKDNTFITLKDEKGKPILSIARAITPDGKYIAGIAIINNKYIPCIWNNGILEKKLNTNGQFAGVNGISADGSIVYGWTTISNRTACFWNPDLNILSPSQSIWSEAYSLSPNKKYILARDGYGRFIYNLTEPDESKRIREIPLLTEDPFNDGGSQIFDDGTALVWESPGSLIQATGYFYYTDNTNKKIADWMKEEWDADIPEEAAFGPGYALFSNDMKTVVGLCSKEDENYYQTVWKFDQEVDYVKPASIQAQSMQATGNVLIKWAQPFVNKDKVTGYKIYRNDLLVTEVAATELSYIDRSPAGTDLTYGVCAMYGTQESEKTSESIKLENTPYAPQPATLKGYQSNYNNITLTWAAPNTGYDANVKLHNGIFSSPFSSNMEKTFWAAVNFNKDIINCYYDNFNLSAVEFYAYAPVDQMTLLIYVNGEEKVSQTIDQSKLIWGANNAIKLDQPLTLAENSEIKAAIKITQSTSGANIGLAQGPAVEGGDLCSEDGTSWTTLTEMSEGELSFNWMISLLFESNKSGKNTSAPALRSDKSLSVQNYSLYRDDEKLGELEAGQSIYVDKNIESGTYIYKIIASYGTIQSEPLTFTQIVRSKTLPQCAAPKNIRGGADNSNKLSLKWDMPEQAEITYTNWEKQIGIGYDGLTEWYYGVEYDSEYMNPYQGFEITKINFYPLTDAAFTLYVYEEDDIIRSQKVDKYTLNKMNTILLDEIVPIKANKKYMIVLQIAGIEKGDMPLGVDTGYPYPGGRMVSEKGLFFQDANVDLTGNLMMGMEVEKTTSGFNPGLTYKITVNGNTQPDVITDTKCTIDYDMSSMQPVNVSVAAIYPAGERMSETTTIDPKNIHSDKVSVVKVYPNPATSFIHIEGNVQEVSMFNIAGKEVYRNMGIQTIDVSSFEPGMYLLKSMIDGKIYINKVQVIR